MDSTEDKIIDLIMEMKTHFIYGNNFISSALLLKIISENKNIRIVDISRKINISPPSVTEALSKLENQGFINREEGDNKREKKVSITNTGRNRMKEFSKLLRSEMKDKISTLSKEDKLILKDNLSIVIDTLKKIK